MSTAKLENKATTIVYNSSSRILDILTNTYNHYIKPTLTEEIRLIPDSVFAGSILLALITQNFSFGMFSVALIESLFIALGLRKVMTFLDLDRTLPSIPTDPLKCSPNAFGVSIENVLDLGGGVLESGFPSFPVYFLTTAVSYIIGGLYSQKQELEGLGAEYASRFYIGLIGSLLLLLLVISYRMLYSCDGVGTMLMSFLFGVLSGFLLLFQNGYLFGRDAVNLTGIPLLRSRTKDGKPLYICTTKGVA